MSRDRLTEKDQFGKWRTEMLPHERVNYLARHDFEGGIWKDYLYGPAIEMLAAYEDLIFSPEVLQAIIKEWKEWADVKNAGRLLILPCKGSLVDRLVEYEQKEVTIMKLTGYTLDQLIQFFAAGSTLTPPSDSSSLSRFATVVRESQDLPLHQRRPNAVRQVCARMAETGEDATG